MCTLPTFETAADALLRADCLAVSIVLSLSCKAFKNPCEQTV